MPRTSYAIDYSSLQLPSDKVTVADIRRVQPELFYGKKLSHVSGLSIIILATHLVERILIDKSIAETQGEADPYPAEDRLTLVCALNDDYVRYGLSSGLQQTQQMIRDFEAAARRFLQTESRDR